MNNLISRPAKQSIIDLSILKSHLRIEHNHEDKYLQNIIDMATEILENKLSESLLEKVYKFTCLPDQLNENHMIELPLNHITKIIKITDSDGKSVPFEFKQIKNKNVVHVAYTNKQIEIQYKAGITNNVDEIPKDIQFAILQIAKNIYECGDDDILETKYIQDVIQAHKNLQL